MAAIDLLLARGRLHASVGGTKRPPARPVLAVAAALFMAALGLAAMGASTALPA